MDLTILRVLFLMFVLASPSLLYCQSPHPDTLSLQLQEEDVSPTDTGYHPGRARLIAVTGVALYAGTLIGLNELWYKDFGRSRFHLFNDSREWLQMDKAGHVITAYHESLLAYKACRWSGVSENKSAWIGGIAGFVLQTPIEILDGFSEKWGFSLSDLAANAAGSVIFISQQLAWQEQKAVLKFSFSPTKYAQHRPNTLGDGLMQEMLKDYNGQTIWLSVPIAEFTPKKWQVPPWLCLSAGYGAEGMIGAIANPAEVNGNPVPPFPRYRQYYLSLDADLAGIETGSKTWNTVLDVISFIKIPAPALELNKEDGIKMHLLQF
ncbi:MAG: DUF2279 domain-containing protein [Bacteroidia bacterium]